ncbi:MAG: DNA-binding NarL/FixJ family response regulator [Myxococcota bacterium]|jgi:DNA-binding NarL/FixJ family response regulator
MYLRTQRGPLNPEFRTDSARLIPSERTIFRAQKVPLVARMSRRKRHIALLTTEGHDTQAIASQLDLEEAVVKRELASDRLGAGHRQC